MAPGDDRRGEQRGVDRTRAPDRERRHREMVAAEDKDPALAAGWPAVEAEAGAAHGVEFHLA